MVAHGSAFPVAKLALNNSVPPILMASLRMGLVLLILIPFWRFRTPDKKYFPALLSFSISMGVMVYVFMNLSLYYSSIISPIILGSQLAIPFGILAHLVIARRDLKMIVANLNLLQVACVDGIVSAVYRIERDVI